MTDELPLTEALELFYSYAHEDEELRDRLETHLSTLKRQKVISGWHDRGLVAGEEWGGEINEHLRTADIILLLVSADFLASDYCYDVELKLAMERHEAGGARVIPVILRPCDWSGAPFGKLQALPKNARPATSWPNLDEAFTDVAKGIRKTAEALHARRTPAGPPAVAAEGASTPGASKAVSSQIPRPPVVGFVARRDDQGRDIVGRLKEELAPANNRLVALWGPGGVGKSTLAAEFVRAAQDAFRGRVAWVGALGRAEFNLATLLDEIATQLGREELRKLAPEPKAAQVGALVSEAATLVVLDNFETVSEEERARCLDFLAQAAACPALITTRAFVNRDDVFNIALAAMSLGEARDFLRRLVERTRTPSNFDRLDRDDLIRRCEANPLVLQWVVRQVDLAKRPQDVLDDLARGEGDAAARVFTRSFNLPQLGEDGRAALLALSLFTPDASREALAEVAGFGDDLRRLGKAVGNLSALWLVETTEGNERVLLRGLTRELAKARLSQYAGAGEVRGRYVRHFLRRAELHDQPTPEDLDALAPDRDNLLHVIDTAAKMRDWESAVRVRCAVDELLYLHGYWDEAIRSGEQAAAAAREDNNAWDVAIFTISVARIRRNRGEHEEARRVYRETLQLSRDTGAEHYVAMCLHELGVLAQEQGEFEEARRFYEESLKISTGLDRQGAMASTMSQIGIMLFIQGKLEEAEANHKASLAIRRGIGEQRGVAIDLHQLGNIAYKRDSMKEAERLYTESLEINRRLGNLSSIASTLNNLGAIANDQGDSKGARRLCAESLEIKRKLGHLDGIALATLNLALLAEEEGDRVEAARLLREALVIYERIRSPVTGEVRAALARVESQ